MVDMFLSTMRCSRNGKKIRILWELNPSGYYYAKEVRSLREGERVPVEFSKKEAKFTSEGFVCSECGSRTWFQCSCGEFNCCSGDGNGTCRKCGWSGSLDSVTDQFSMSNCD